MLDKVRKFSVVELDCFYDHSLSSFSHAFLPFSLLRLLYTANPLGNYSEKHEMIESLNEWEKMCSIYLVRFEKNERKRSR